MNGGLSQGTESSITAKPARLYYLDWLRVLAMFCIFFFHNARFFDFEDWHVKNDVTSLGADIFVGFCNQWLMPLFFILAGAAVYYSLKSRKARAFIKERTLRILIPLVIVGYFVICPPQVYLERLTHGEFSGTFFQFYPHYFDGLYGLGGNFAWMGMHLWFLVLLFACSLVTLPFFLPRKGTGRSLSSRLATLFEKPWTLIIPVLLFVGLEGFIDIPVKPGGWSFISYLVFFIGGYMIFSNTQIQENIKRYAVIALVTAVVLQTVEYTLWFAIKPDIPVGSPEYAGIGIMIYLRRLCWILAILGLGSRFLNRNNRFLSYANEAVLPFYILHQTIILSIGFYVVQWNMVIPLKYLIISTSSFAVIMAIYDLLVRRINVLRFLFGMRLKEKPKTTQQPN
ncbi:acyltransferase family protein [Chloroflexota bacterium]